MLPPLVEVHGVPVFCYPMINWRISHAKLWWEVCQPASYYGRQKGGLPTAPQWPGYLDERQVVEVVASTFPTLLAPDLELVTSCMLDI